MQWCVPGGGGGGEGGQKASRLCLLLNSSFFLVREYILRGKKAELKVADWPRGYKTFFMLNSPEHEILNAHKYENINKVSIFQAQISLECYFSCS